MISVPKKLTRLAYLALPLFALAACSPEPAEEAATPDAETAEPMENATLDLQATGIIIPPQNGFEQYDVPFGSMRAATEVTLANVLGEAIGQSEEPNDCGLDYTQYQGLTVNFSDGEFVGYWAESPYVPELPRAEMLGDAGVQLSEDDAALDDEFVIGDPQGQAIGGVFTGGEDDAAVRALWAGENCIAR